MPRNFFSTIRYWVYQIDLSRRLVQLATMCFLAAPTSLHSQTAMPDCSPASFNKHVKTISTFRLMEVYINTLVHAQARAILEVETGVPMSGADAGDFFGPLGLLGKTMDKAQTDIKSLAIAGRRLKFDTEVNDRFVEMSETADVVISVGFEMVSVLENKDIIGATQLFHSRSIPAHTDALGAAHTIISGLERQSAIQAAKCR